MTEQLELALAAFETLKTPSRVAGALREGGASALETEYAGLPSGTRNCVDQKAREMRRNHIDVVLFGTKDFPGILVQDRRPVAPVIFFRGAKDLFYRDGIGICGSRHFSDRGLDAASRYGRYATEMGLTVVSGYAAGVDAAALRAGGNTVIVLAEGMDHFRINRAFAGDFDQDRILVLSQFPSSQPWMPRAAMARNAIIFGLPKALLVVEAGERGGALAAGEGALKLGRSVIAVDFGEETPPGNRILIEKGARPVRTPPQLRATDEVHSAPFVDDTPTLFQRGRVSSV